MVSQSTCCNTCNDVKEAYEKRGWLLTDLDGVEQCAREGVKSLAPAEYDPTEGCNVKGYIEVLKLSGKFHLVRLGLPWWAHEWFSNRFSPLSVNRPGERLGVCVLASAEVLTVLVQWVLDALTPRCDIVFDTNRRQATVLLGKATTFTI